MQSIVRSTEIPRHVTPRKIAGSLQINIPKTIKAITDLKIVNFAREHHFITQKKRNYCILYYELGFKPEEALDLHLNNKNMDFKGRWRGTRTRKNIYNAILHYVLKVNALKSIIEGLDNRILSITFGSEIWYIKLRPAIEI